MAWHRWKACFKVTRWAAGAAALAIGCSHAWDDLEPLSGMGGSGGRGSAVTSSVTSGNTSSGGDGSSSSNGGEQFVIYPASVAACISETFPDTDACEAVTGKGKMNVDLSGGVDKADLSFVRFEINGALAGKTIDTVTLELVVANELGSGSDHSGEVWEVMPFTLNTLNNAVPPKVGVLPASGDQGSVSPLQSVKWPLPTSIVTLNSGLFLGVFPKSDNSANYWNTSGPTPPRLMITYH